MSLHFVYRQNIVDFYSYMYNIIKWQHNLSVKLPRMHFAHPLKSLSQPPLLAVPRSKRWVRSWLVAMVTTVQHDVLQHQNCLLVFQLFTFVKRRHVRVRACVCVRACVRVCVCVCVFCTSVNSLSNDDTAAHHSFWNEKLLCRSVHQHQSIREVV